MAISGHATDQAVIATMTVGTVLGVFAVAARLFTRIVIVRKAGWDDAIICAGCVSLLNLGIDGALRLTIPRFLPLSIQSLHVDVVSFLSRRPVADVR